MSNLKIQKIWQDSYGDYCQSGHFQSEEQRKASRAILACKSGRLGVNVSECSECGHMEFHNSSCRNRNCPCCQAVLKRSGLINAGCKSLTPLTSMWCLHSRTNLIP